MINLSRGATIDRVCTEVSVQQIYPEVEQTNQAQNYNKLYRPFVFAAKERMQWLLRLDPVFKVLCLQDYVDFTPSLSFRRDDMHLTRKDFGFLLGLRESQVEKITTKRTLDRSLRLLLKRLEQAPKATGNLLLDYRESLLPTEEDKLTISRIRERLRWLRA